MKRRRVSISNGIFYLILTAYAGISMYPFLWMASSAFKSNNEIGVNQSLIPQVLRLDIIVDVWNRLDFWKYTLNSAIVSSAVVIGIVVVYSLAGYGFAKTIFPGREYFFYGFLAMLLVPSVTVFIPLVQELKAFGLIGRDSNQFLTYIGLILPIINGGGPFAVFLFRNFFASLPHELHEAARVDGCSELGIYFRIFLPLSAPVIVTVGIVNLISSWNDYIWPAVIINNPDWYTLPLKLRDLDLQQIVQWNVRMAGSLITIAPIVIIFLFLQRYYIRGLTAGAVKA